MRECPACAKAEIDRLKQKGVELDYDDVVWLASLGDKVEKPSQRVNPFLVRNPVTAGNVTLYEMTIQGGMFLDYVSGENLAPDYDNIPLLAWILANGRRPGYFQQFAGRRQLREELVRFKAECAATMNELAEAVDRIIDDDAPDRDMPERMKLDYFDYLSSLEAVSGRSREEWETRTSREANGVIRHAYKLRHGSEDDRDSEKAEVRENMKNLLAAVREIETKHGVSDEQA